MSEPKEKKLVSYDEELGEIDDTAPGNASDDRQDENDVILAPEPPKK